MSSAVCCRVLFPVCCLLRAVRSSLFDDCCLLLLVRCLLWVVRWSLFVVVLRRCSLCVFWLFVVVGCL